MKNNIKPSYTLTNNSQSQPSYTLTNYQLMMLLERQNRFTPKHSVNMARIIREKSTTHIPENTGAMSYCLISATNKKNEWVISSVATNHMCGLLVQL